MSAVGLLAHAGPGLPPITPSVVITRAEPLNPATVGLLVAAGLYLWGVVRLRQRGLAWPPARTAIFFGGLAAIGFVLVSGLAAYDTTLVSVHMVQHMVLSMVAPILLALGAPVPLALRALAARPLALRALAARPPAGLVAGSAAASSRAIAVRRGLLRLLHSRFARVATFPLVSYGLFVASPFVLYFSGLYRVTMANPVVHVLVHLHLIAVGCLFFWPLIGLDPLPGRAAYPLRALMMFLSTPFHTVLGLTVMQSSQLLGGDWYPALKLAWLDPYADQRLAGGILWAGGEFVAVAMLGALVFQWMRQSEREARRIDRALDRAELEAALGSARGYEAENHR